MAEYINRDAYIRYLSSRKAEFVDDFGQGWCAGIDTAISACEKFPAADVEPVRHGRWISWEDAGNFIPSPDRHECSVCHDAAQVLVNGIELLSPYCPNCGAKMDEVSE